MAQRTNKRKWPPSALGRLISRRLDALGLTQAQLGDRLGYSNSYISQIERGRVPDVGAPDFVEKWAKALEISPDVLIAEGELRRYNVVPHEQGDLKPGQQLLVALTDHLPDEVVHRIAAAVRAQYGEPEPKPDTPTEERHAATQPTPDANAPPRQAG